MVVEEEEVLEVEGDEDLVEGEEMVEVEGEEEVDEDMVENREGVVEVEVKGGGEEQDGGGWEEGGR